MTAKVISGIKNGFSGLIGGGSSSKSSNSNEPAFLSGGLAGAVGRKMTNSAVESVTGGEGGLIGKQRFESSIKEGGKFANDVIGKIATGSKSGYITGDRAKEALSSYLGHTQANTQNKINDLGKENNNEPITSGTSISANNPIESNLGSSSTHDNSSLNIRGNKDNNDSIERLGIDNIGKISSSSDSAVVGMGELGLQDTQNITDNIPESSESSYGIPQDSLNTFDNNIGDYGNNISDNADNLQDLSGNTLENMPNIDNLGTSPNVSNEISGLGSISSENSISNSNDKSIISDSTKDNFSNSQQVQNSSVVSDLGQQSSIQIGNSVDSANTVSNYSNISSDLGNVSTPNSSGLVVNGSSDNITDYQESNSDGLSAGYNSEPISIPKSEIGIEQGNIPFTNDYNNLSSDLGLSQMNNTIPNYSNVEIGNGRITGIEETSSYPNGIEFAMYSSEKYMKPDGEFELIKTKDGAEWFKQYAVDTVERKPKIDLESKKVTYDESIVKKIPKAPQRKDRI